MILPDRDILRFATDHEMIDPFTAAQVKQREGRRIVSYGLSSFGYDVRLANEFKIFHNATAGAIDPMCFDEDSFISRTEKYHVIVPPNSFVLGRSVEYMKMPEDVIAICLGKSTYARCGIIVNVTPLEPGWHGHITIEISNTTPLPAKVYVYQGIAQLLFFKGGRPAVTYADRNGKYQGQTGVTLPR